MTDVTRLPGKDLVWLQRDRFAIILRSRQAIRIRDTLDGFTCSL